MTTVKLREPNVISILEQLGLSSPEVTVYLALLELGSQPVSTIAKKANLKRGHTYNVLSLLIEKGIAQEFTKKKVRHFTAVSPGALLSMLDRKQEEIEEKKQRLLQILPNLEKLRNPLLVQPTVRFFQGVEGLKEIYEDTISMPGRPIYALADFDYVFPKAQEKEYNDWIWDYADRRAERNVWYYGVFNKSPESNLGFRRRKEQKRKMKMLVNVYLPVEVNIYGSKVAIMSTHADMVGIIIEDAPIAETLKNFHQAMWAYLPDYEI